MSVILRLVFGSICLGLLGACGGGGGGGDDSAGTGGGGGSIPQTEYIYQPLDSGGDQDSEIRLIGIVGSGDDPSGTGSAIGNRSGRRDALRLGTFLNDTDGRDSKGIWNDANTRVAGIQSGSVLASIFDGQYDFVIPVQVEGTNLRDNSVAILGVRTRGSDMPTNGSATFTGQGIVARNTNGSSGSFVNQTSSTGDVRLEANFGSRSVTLTMNDLNALGSSGEIGFDDLRISGMQIARGSDTFSGGTLTTRDNGGSYGRGVTGANPDLDSRGGFFGGTSATPEEAGGTFVLTGDDGVVFGTFVADQR